MNEVKERRGKNAKKVRDAAATVVGAMTGAK